MHWCIAWQSRSIISTGKEGRMMLRKVAWMEEMVGYLAWMERMTLVSVVPMAAQDWRPEDRGPR